MITSILFDLDGTLIDHVTAIESAAGTLFDNVLGHPAIDRRSTFIERWKTLNRDWYQRFFAQQVSFQESARGKLRDAFLPFGVHFTDSNADMTLAEYFDNYIAMCRVFADVGPCLSQLTTYKLGVITNGQEIQQVEKIRRCGLASSLPVVVTAEAAGSAKPDSQVFDEACTRLGVNKDEALYVGDDLEIDAIAAQNAGMTGIWLNRFGAEATNCPRDVTAISSLDELENLL